MSVRRNKQAGVSKTSVGRSRIRSAPARIRYVLLKIRSELRRISGVIFKMSGGSLKTKRLVRHLRISDHEMRHGFHGLSRIEKSFLESVEISGIRVKAFAGIRVHPPCSRPSRQVRVHPWLTFSLWP